MASRPNKPITVTLVDDYDVERWAETTWSTSTATESSSPSWTQAVPWGVDHGFTPDYHRIEHWKGGP